ncbi:Ribosomal lysine N-methyltransferase 5 [Candida viswanathii]|uniref:Ribosomal lysine N-methyltransferase 5 n=1 Tax=Candida viswanathii TaxID=5486 RepID=A0A367YPA5_9ASCO|nr:Ribosomal lysine N-methyltransferase 5 [Candida viswanathii]
MSLRFRWISQCEVIDEENVEEHIFELYSERELQNNLGYHDRTANKITIELPHSHQDFSISQSLSRLSDHKVNSSTTGFVCWDASIYFADWLLASPVCPVTLSKDFTVLELGSGVGGIVACALQDKVGRYVATDQKHLLELLEENIVNNTPRKNYDVVEFDWEDIECGLEALKELGVDGESVDVVVACDTIYNEYLIPYFLNAMKSVMSGSTVAIVCLQLRDSITFEHFVHTIIGDEELELSNVPGRLLSAELNNGFVVYALTKK